MGFDSLRFHTDVSNWSFINLVESVIGFLENVPNYLIGTDISRKYYAAHPVTEIH